MQTRSKLGSHLRALDRKLKVSGISPTLGRGKRMCRQAGNHSKNSLLAFMNRPKLFLQTRSKPAGHLRALDGRLKVSGISHSLGRGKHMRRHTGTQDGNSSLASWNRPKLFLQSRSKPPSHLRALNGSLKVCEILPILGRGKRMCN